MPLKSINQSSLDLISCLDSFHFFFSLAPIIKRLFSHRMGFLLVFAFGDDDINCISEWRTHKHRSTELFSNHSCKQNIEKESIGWRKGRDWLIKKNQSVNLISIFLTSICSWITCKGTGICWWGVFFSFFFFLFSLIAYQSSCVI